MELINHTQILHQVSMYLCICVFTVYVVVSHGCHHGYQVFIFSAQLPCHLTFTTHTFSHLALVEKLFPAELQDLAMAGCVAFFVVLLHVPTTFEYHNTVLMNQFHANVSRIGRLTCCPYSLWFCFKCVLWIVRPFSLLPLYLIANVCALSMILSTKYICRSYSTRIFLGHPTCPLSWLQHFSRSFNSCSLNKSASNLAVLIQMLDALSGMLVPG